MARSRHPMSVNIKGLRQLDRALGKTDKNLRKNLRDQLKQVAEEVAGDARAIATSKDLRQSGDLIAGIRPFALTGKAGVRNTATHRGFAYPSRHEYENRGGASYGPRASINPAVDRNQPEIRRGIEHVLDQLDRDFSS